MKLDYFDLIKYEPIYFDGIGGIKSPLLKDISKIGYKAYKYYISVLFMTARGYYESFEKDKLNWYDSLKEEEKLKISLYDLIIKNLYTRNLFVEIFNYFFVEEIKYNDNYNVFTLHNGTIENDRLLITGAINKNNFNKVCDIILQRNAMNRNSDQEDLSKAKNKKALEILKKLKKGREKMNKKKKQDKKLSLPNMISSLAAKDSSLNIINIWDITVYQLYDQFNRQRTNDVYGIGSMSIAVWGDKNKKFDETQWFQYMCD